jgi:hypothetical protein
MNIELKNFYDFLTQGNTAIYGTGLQIGKSTPRVSFVNSFEELEKLVQGGKITHISYNPYKSCDNFKTENCKEINMIGLDIERTDKIKPETVDRLVELNCYILVLTELLHLNEYMLLRSGNGFHMYIPITPIELNDTNRNFLREGYRNFIKGIHNIIASDKRIKDKFKCDDRCDLVGMLRLPGVVNPSANRLVIVEDIIRTNTEKNTEIRKCLLISVENAIKDMNFTIGKVRQPTSLLLPSNPVELNSHPLVLLLMDDTLPRVSGWYRTVVFALQTIVRECGFTDKDVRQLQYRINNKWDMCVNLTKCSKGDLHSAYYGAINFCRKNGFNEYEKQLCGLLTSKI